MAALHHVSMALDDAEGWAAMADALVDGDQVVLLDRAARELQRGFPASPTARLWPLLAQRAHVRWLLPTAERATAVALPDAIELIDEERWLELVAAHPLLLDWN